MPSTLAVQTTQSQTDSGWKGSQWLICSSRATPEHMAQDCVQLVAGYLQKGRLHTLSGQAVPVLGHCTGEKFFLMSRWNFCASVSAYCLLSYCLAPPFTHKISQLTIVYKDRSQAGEATAAFQGMFMIRSIKYLLQIKAQ